MRRLEKDTVWSCDGPACKDVGEGTFPEKSRCLIIRASWKHRITKIEGEKGERGEIEGGYNCVMGRYRCVHYADGGKCNRDLCGDCFKPKEASTSPQVFSNQALPVSLLVTQGGNNEVSRSSQDSLF